MRFVVSRASCWDDEKPCVEAKRMEITELDIRRFRSPDEFDKIRGHREGSWLSGGKNHCITKDGHIQRELGPKEVWYVEIETLEELVEFKNRHGQIIILDCVDNPSETEIAIYDGYRE